MTVKVGHFPFIGNGKAIALGEPEGMIKTVFDAKTGELLGAHMVGAEVTELIQGYVIGRTLETTEAELMETVFPHPTLSEMMHEVGARRLRSRDPLLIARGRCLRALGTGAPRVSTRCRRHCASRTSRAGCTPLHSQASAGSALRFPSVLQTGRTRPAAGRAAIADQSRGGRDQRGS